MGAVRLIAIVLIIAGILGLAYGSFTYTRDTKEVDLGPVEFSVKRKKTVPIPAWAGIGAIVGGGLLLLAGRKKA